MLWIRTGNPRVWQASDGQHYCHAQPDPHVEGFVVEGFVARIYRWPVQYSFLDRRPDLLVGTAMWGLDEEAALRMSIKLFDEEAELPEEEEQVLPCP